MSRYTFICPNKKCGCKNFSYTLKDYDRKLKTFIEYGVPPQDEGVQLHHRPKKSFLTCVTCVCNIFRKPINYDKYKYDYFNNIIISIYNDEIIFHEIKDDKIYALKIKKFKTKEEIEYFHNFLETTDEIYRDKNLRNEDKIKKIKSCSEGFMFSISEEKMAKFIKR
jgi:hypothetical protein